MYSIFLKCPSKYVVQQTAGQSRNAPEYQNRNRFGMYTSLQNSMVCTTAQHSKDTSSPIRPSLYYCLSLYCLSCTALYCCIVLYSTELLYYCTVWYGTVPNRTEPNRTVLYCTVQNRVPPRTTEEDGCDLQLYPSPCPLVMYETCGSISKKGTVFSRFRVFPHDETYETHAPHSIRSQFHGTPQVQDN